ncbi:DUF2190 family protein [Rhodocyclus gracilis]|uniref:DUF2190 domain-containing protein n=1 Tax=Rhodocyclus tenuis TaxID=1066 RepID=A0A6L5JVH6_RHOTE|nr:DUF2190 family protein [Rhodocyclus gracilis]MQY50168.1 hypothetical protein [Rhodocyclus gracilis]
MSQQAISILSLPFLANGAVQEYRAVGFNGAQASAAGQKVLGIAEFSVASGAYGRACRLGTAVAEAGGAFAVETALTVDAVGRVVAAAPIAIAAGATAVTSAAANGATDITGGDPAQYIVGYAMQAAGASGDLVEIAMA